MEYLQIINDDALTAYQKYVVDWDTFNPAHLDSNKNNVTQEYDALNRIRKATYPADRDGPGKEMYPEYNKGGALLSLKMGSTDYVKEVAYNARGQRILIAYGNKIMTRYAYDPKTFRVLRQRSALFIQSGHSYTPNKGIRQDLQYTYDLEGTIKTINDAAPANNYAQGPGDLLRVFTHDPLRRLLSATGRESSNVYKQPSWDLNVRPQIHGETNPYIRSYEYDKIGNIQKLKHAAEGEANQDFNRGYGYDSSDNNLKSFTVNSTTYINQYDANGSLTKEGESRYYEWGANDKLAVFKNQAGSSTPSVYTNYFYNAQGERIKKHTRKGNKIVVTFYMDGGMFETTYTKTVGGSIDNNRYYNTIKISDDGALIATIRVGNNVDDSTPAIKYIVGDHLNNSTAVLKATTGSLINREEYYPFGETSFGSYQYKRYRYNGKEKDEESGLYEYGQRYYAPWLCRFVSVDPIAEGYPQLSSYNYAGNKPITSPDIEGLQGTEDGGGKPSGGGDQTTVVGVQKINGAEYNRLNTFEVTGTQTPDEGASQMAKEQFINPRDGMSIDRPVEQFYHQGSSENQAGWYSSQDYAKMVYKEGYILGLSSQNAQGSYGDFSSLDHSNSFFTDGRNLSNDFEERFASAYFSGVVDGVAQHHFNMSGKVETSNIDFDLLTLGSPKILKSIISGVRNVGKNGVDVLAKRVALNVADDVTTRTSGALRKVGDVFESVDDVLANPSLLEGMSFYQVRGVLNNTKGWINSVMTKTRGTDKGWVLREVNDKGLTTGRLIQYHPGSRRHFGGNPYWKVSDGVNSYRYQAN